MAVVNESVGDGGGGLNPAALFTMVWETLTELLGTAATAAIVRRAAGRAVTESLELVDLVIRRENLEYRYTLPHTWSRWVTADGVPIALRTLVAEIGRVLGELTGTVVVGRLEQIPELRAGRLLWRAAEAN